MLSAHGRYSQSYGISCGQQWNFGIVFRWKQAWRKAYSFLFKIAYESN